MWRQWSTRTSASLCGMLGDRTRSGLSGDTTSKTHRCMIYVVCVATTPQNIGSVEATFVCGNSCSIFYWAMVGCDMYVCMHACVCVVVCVIDLGRWKGGI